MDKSREADAIVGSLSQAMASGETGLRYVPALLVRVINEGMWRERVITKTGMPATFKSFEEFVTTQPLEGLGADLPTLKRLCADNPAALDALDRATLHQGARTDLPNNVMKVEPKEQGNSAEYALRKLRNNAPEVHARVIAGELSPHAGMVEAGFRRKTIQITASVAGMERAIFRYLNREERIELIGRLSRANESEASE